jgi:hypothetical protein
VNKHQTILLKRDQAVEANPRKSFVKDVIHLIQTIETDPRCDEDIDDSEGGLRKIITETMLMDVFPIVNDLECDTETYTWGKKRLDYILTSKSLLVITNFF